MECVIKKILKFILLIIICFTVQQILDVFGLLEILNRDINILTIDEFLEIYGVISILFFVFSLFQFEINSLNTFLKKHCKYIVIALWIVELVVLYKCSLLYQFQICIIEFGVIYYCLDYISVKTYKYKMMENKRTNSNYVEKPVVGKENLTSSQLQTMLELQKLIDARKSTDSFNIALIGAWGCGKTSITDTLIYEYQKRWIGKKYFMLKISALTLHETKNIVLYVKSFFENLFRKYEIGINGENVAFLTSLAKCFGDSVPFGEMLSGVKDEVFIDIEKERELFIKQVRKLLKISGRKNILFFIDDTDRSEEEDQIIKVLVEFAAIDGVISIISLDSSRDVIIRPTLLVKESKLTYNPIDKYIHVRIRVENDNHIENDKNITSQIKLSFKGISFKDNCFISCNEENIRKSLFESIKDYQTTEIIKHNHFSNNNYNILTELFFYNLESQSTPFGDYFGGLVTEYIYNSKELMPYIKQMLTIPPNEWNHDILLLNAQWTNSFGMEDFDWLIRLMNNSQTLFFTLCDMVSALEYITNLDNYLKRQIKSIEDVYDFWMINRCPEMGRTMKNRKENPIVYSGINQVKFVVFGAIVSENIDRYIKEGQYDQANQIIKSKLEGVTNLFLLAMVLHDFMLYLRNVLNNYRLFKMQLRETEIINANYLDYLIHEWKPTKEITDFWEKIKEATPIISELNVSFPSISAFINNVLFENYISKFGNRFVNGELKNSRIYLYHGKKKTMIVISKKNQPIENCIILDISGSILTQISELDLCEIANKNNGIWAN